ncbi:MAG: hypothetical protein AB2L18_12640 [Anaerolineaceae bacterium]
MSMAMQDENRVPRGNVERAARLLQRDRLACASQHSFRRSDNRARSQLTSAKDSAFRERHKVRFSLVLQFWEGPITAEYPLCGAKIGRGRGEWQFLVPLRAGSPSTRRHFRQLLLAEMAKQSTPLPLWGCAKEGVVWRGKLRQGDGPTQ